MTTTTKQEENIFEPIDYKHKKGILDFDFLHAVSKWVNMPMELDGIFSECTLFSKHRNRKLMFGLFFFCLAFKTHILYNVTHCLPMQCICIVWMMQKSGIKISVKTIKPVSFPVHSLSLSRSLAESVVIFRDDVLMRTANYMNQFYFEFRCLCAHSRQFHLLPIAL